MEAFKIYLLILTTITFTTCAAQKGPQSASRIIAGFGKSGSVHTRPDTPEELHTRPAELLRDMGGKPAAIPCPIHMKDMTVDLYLRRHWQDSRLAYENGPSSVHLNPSIASKLVWVPDLFVTNAKASVLHETSQPDWGVRVWQDGTVRMSAKHSFTLHCVMDLRRFPFDQQECQMNIETYMSSGSELQLQWKENGFLMATDMSPVAFNVVGSRYSTCSNSTGYADFPCLDVFFTFKRISTHYMALTFVPLFFLMTLTSLIFWLPLAALTGRTVFGGFLFLSTVVLVASSQIGAPQVGYLKALDVWCLTCMVFVTVAILEIIALHLLRIHSQSMTKESIELEGDECRADTTALTVNPKSLFLHQNVLTKVDHGLKIAFPVAFFLFVVIFFAVM